MSSFGIYFGELQINIAQIESDKTNNYCELVSIKYVMELQIVLKKLKYYKKKILILNLILYRFKILCGFYKFMA